MKEKKIISQPKGEGGGGGKLRNSKK